MFVNYLSRPNVRQPILTQYCDGDRVSCPNWMTQWGSKYLGDQGYSAIEILRYFYGNSMYINTAEQVSGVPASWPRVDLQVGSRGNNVRVIQEQLNAIARNYPAIPTVTVDGIFGPETRAAVQKFQSVFNLPVSGVVFTAKIPQRRSVPSRKYLTCHRPALWTIRPGIKFRKFTLLLRELQNYINREADFYLKYN